MLSELGSLPGIGQYVLNSGSSMRPLTPPFSLTSSKYALVDLVLIDAHVVDEVLDASEVDERDRDLDRIHGDAGPELARRLARLRRRGLGARARPIVVVATARRERASTSAPTIENTSNRRTGHPLAAAQCGRRRPSVARASRNAEHVTSPHGFLDDRTNAATLRVATFTRPPRNLMSMAAMGELEQLAGEVAADPEIAVLVLTGGVDGYFVAHADLDDLTKLGKGEAVDGDPGSWARTFTQLEAMPQPVVAAVDGQAWGGGCELSLACTFASPANVRTSVSPKSRSASSRVPVGRSGFPASSARAGRPSWCCRPASSTPPKRCASDSSKRCSRTTASSQRVLEWVQPMATKPRPALFAAKRAVIDGLRLPLDEGLRLEGRLFIECQARPDTIALQARVADAERAAPPDRRFDL